MKQHLAVIIVNWNVRDLLIPCLRSVEASLARAKEIQGHIWVVDNASTDGSVEVLRREFPHVHLITLEENIGFAAANNLALRAMGLLKGQEDSPLYERSSRVLPHPTLPKPPASLPDAVLFLNPDTEVAPDAIPRLWSTLFAHPRTGVVGPRLEYGDGTHQHSGFRFPGLVQVFFDFFPLHGRLLVSRLNGRYSATLYRGRSPFPVDFLLGAAMLVRREVIEQVGAFDESYWLYCEEMDWAQRIRAAGWEIRVEPRARVVHYEGQSSRRFRGRAFVALWESRLRYFRRYHGEVFNAILRALVYLGVWWRERQARRHPTPDHRERLEAYAQVRALLRKKFP